MRPYHLAILLTACSANDAYEPPGPSAVVFRGEPPQANRDLSVSRRILEEATVSEDYSVRMVVAEALTCVATPWSLALLERLLGDPEEDVRAASLISLASRTEERALALIRSVRDDHSERLALRALAVRSLLRPRPCSR